MGLALLILTQFLIHSGTEQPNETIALTIVLVALSGLMLTASGGDELLKNNKEH